MTESMIERVARGIKGRVPAGYGMTDNEALEYARAAIEAMREPTDAMVDAMDEHAGTIAPEYAYEAAIDAALNEQVAGARHD